MPFFLFGTRLQFVQLSTIYYCSPLIILLIFGTVSPISDLGIEYTLSCYELESVTSL